MVGLTERTEPGSMCNVLAGDVDGRSARRGEGVLRERTMLERGEAVIIGAGHAGLSTSYYLSQAGVEHTVLEQGRIGETWRSKRWDSFTLVTPNWMCNLPGFPYAGDDPDGFMPRDEVVAYLTGYAESFGAPVREGVRARSVRPHGRGYAVETDRGTYEAPVVVVASGFFEGPKVPAVAARLSPEFTQVHSSQYKNPEALPPGAVLVVGSAQSGCQIAEDLQLGGRQVYLCTSSAGRVLRRYRGKDGVWWSAQAGVYDKTVDTLPSPKAKFAANPHASGARGGHTINLHRFARDGMVLLGHFRDVEGDRAVRLAPDLKENLARADKVAADSRQTADETAQRLGLPFPPPQPDNTDEYEGDDGFRQEEILELDLREAGISAIVWAAGFSFDYSFVRLPVFDEVGYPIQQRGVTRYPGLYFMGVHFQYRAKSDLFYGVGDDAAYVAAAISAQLGKESGSPAVQAGG